MQHEKRIGSPQSRDQRRDPVRQKMTCNTGSDGIRDVMVRVAEMISTSGCRSAALCENAQLAIAEVLNNIEEHSYMGKPGRPIRLEIEISDQMIAVETTDFGVPMPGLAVPEKKLPSADVSKEALPEGGFGWFLIHTLAPAPKYIRCRNRNILKFEIPCGDV